MTRVETIEDAGHLPPGPCALQQHPRYGAAVTALGGGVVQLRDDGGATALIVRRKLGPVPVCWMPRGPVTAPGLDPDASIRAILAHLPRGVRLVLPGDAAQAPLYRAAGYSAILTGAHVAELDLHPPKAARLAAQHGKWRNRLHRALDGPLQITHRAFDPASDTGLFSLEQAQRRARRYRALPARFTLAYAATGVDAARVFLAHHKGGLAGFLLLLLHPPVATYHIGWTGPEGRRLGAHPLLLWRASNWLAQNGVTRLDLGSLDTKTAPGLARFKLGMGARAVALGPTLLRLPCLTRARPAA